MNHIKRKKIVVVISCLLLGFILRFYTFDRKSLWIDEIYTYNDSRDDLKAQLNYYQQNPTYLQPPLFFVLTHLLYPFTSPERDLRIIPLIFGTLSIPVMYFLSKSFSPNIALPCTLSLALMTYHISLSQDARSYAFLMFIGMVGLYFFMNYSKTSKTRYLPLTALSFATMFYTSYSSIPFIALSQILWFYRTSKDNRTPRFHPFLVLNGILLLLCLPWVLFLALNYHGQAMLNPYEPRIVVSFWDILSGVLNDWAPYAPLTTVSVILFISLLFFSNSKVNAVLLVSVFVLPILGLFSCCRLFNISHFVTSRYFINFLPLFIITLFLSLNTIEWRFERLNKLVRFRFLFTALFIASNLVILPFYYRAEKQDFRGLVSYLKNQLREGDRLLDGDMAYTPGILHYFGVYPEKRHYEIPYYKVTSDEIEFRKSFVFQNRNYTLYSSRASCSRYVADGSRLWIIAGKANTKKILANFPVTLKGYFDGSFLNFNRFPTDVSLYLSLWDTQLSTKGGTDTPTK
jgi:mannosyltransferase